MPDDRTDWDAYLKWFQTLGCPQASLEDVVEHVLHAATVAGVDHVGIGSDFDGVPSLPDGLQNASQLPALTARLMDRGMSEDEVTKILGGNFMRVFEQIEKGKK
jgi:membrane dipeptidase